MLEQKKKKLFSFLPHLFPKFFLCNVCTKGRKNTTFSIANDNFRVIGRRPSSTHPAEAKSHPASVSSRCY